MIKFINVHMGLSEKFGLSFQENAYLTAIAGLQSLECYGFWAVMPNADYCQALTISERTLQAMSKDLERRGLLIRGNGTQKRASQEFCKAYILEKAGGAEIAGGAKTAPLGVQKLYDEGAKIAPNNKEYKESNNTLSIGEDNFFQTAVEANRAKLTPYESLKALPMPDHLQGAQEHFARWLDDQHERGKKVTRAQAEIALKNLGMICKTEAEAISAIEKSIINGYNKFYYNEQHSDKGGGTPKGMAGGVSKPKGDARGGHKVEQTERYIFD